MIRPPMRDDDCDFGEANRNRRSDPDWLAESPDLDAFVMECFPKMLHLLKKAGARPHDAAAAAGDVVASLYTDHHSSISLPLLDALSLTFWIRDRIQDADFSHEWNAGSATAGGRESRSDLLGSYRALLNGMTPTQQQLVANVYRPLAQRDVVVLLAAPKLQVCEKLFSLWSLAPVPGNVGRGVSGHDID